MFTYFTLFVFQEDEVMREEAGLKNFAGIDTVGLGCTLGEQRDIKL